MNHEHTDAVLMQVRSEREFQERKFGTQNHAPAFWMPILMEEVGEAARAICESMLAGRCTTPEISEEDLVRRCWREYRAELVQVAAVGPI